jgi:mannosyl-3-phosphoglycerate phosphatase
VDGVLAQSSPTAWATAARVLAPLADENVPIVLCSSQTRAELELVQQKLGLRHPFICEHGGAALVPSGHFAFSIPGARERPGYEAVEFGGRYRDIVETLQRVAARHGIEITAFHDMSIDAVAHACRLPLLQARLAKLREYAEPFRVVDASATARPRLLRALQSVGLRCRPVHSFDHVGAHADSSAGVSLLRNLYRRAWGDVTTLGITDPTADDTLVPLVDYSVIVPRDDVARGAVDVADWAEAIADVVSDLRHHSAGRRRAHAL